MFTSLKIHKDTPAVKQKLIHKLQEVLASVGDREIIVLCVGTDRSTGDALGPLVGTSLAHAAVPVLGTLMDPVHAGNLEVRVKEVPQGAFIIAVDACLGERATVGNINILPGPLHPGAGVGKELISVGDMHISGVVDVGGFMEYLTLQNTRLAFVMELAELIAEAIEAVIIQRGTDRKVAVGIDVE